MLRLVPALALSASVWAAADPGPAAPDGINRDAVKEYLLAHPDMVLDDREIGEAVRRAQFEREQKRAAAERRSVLEASEDLLHASLTPSSGDTEATVMVIEFYDYQCVPCKASYPELQRAKAARPDVHYIYGQLPIYGSYSVMAARAAIAAHRQGLFEAFHDALMAAQLPLDMDSIVGAAAQAGLDVGQLQADMRDADVAAYLEEVQLLAEALGVMGTPSFVIGDVLLSGGVLTADLTEELDRQRTKSDSKSWQ